jgi:hypothetical protein
MPAERTISMSFRVTPKFRRLLAAAARKENRSLTNLLETLLYEFCSRHGIEDSTPGAELEHVARIAEPSNVKRPKANRRS